MSAKLATPGLLISAYEITNKMLSRDSNYIVDVVRCGLWYLYERSYLNVNFTSI